MTRVASDYQQRAAQIMKVADMLRPAMLHRLGVCHDAEGRPIAPERINAIALIVAQHIVKNGKAA